MKPAEIQQQIDHHQASIRLLQDAHPRAVRAMNMAEGISPPMLTPDTTRAITTLRWLQAEVSRLEKQLQEVAA